jgi:integrase
MSMHPLHDDRPHPRAYGDRASAMRQYCLLALALAAAVLGAGCKRTGEPTTAWGPVPTEAPDRFMTPGADGDRDGVNVTDRNPAAVAERLRTTSGEITDDSDIDSLGYVPAPEEAWRLIENAEPGLFQSYFLTAVLTGARQEELLAHGWADVDLDGPTIKIRRAISWARTRSERETVKGARFFEPKTRSSKRTIPIPRDLAAALKRWKLACPIGTLDLVFPMADGSPMHRKVLYDYGLLPALKRAKLPHFTIHALRHTFASTLAMQGKPVTEVAALLGHSSPVVSLRVYSHWFKNMKTTSTEDVAAAVFGGRAL